MRASTRLIERWSPGKYLLAGGGEAPVALRGRIGYDGGMANTNFDTAAEEILAEVKPALKKRLVDGLLGSLNAVTFRHALWCGTLFLLFHDVLAALAALFSNWAAWVAAHP